VQLILGQVYATATTTKRSLFDQAIKVNNQDFRPVLAKASILNQQGKPSRQKPCLKCRCLSTYNTKKINRLEGPTVNKRVGELRELREGENRADSSLLVKHLASNDTEDEKGTPERMCALGHMPPSIRPQVLIAQIACPRMAPVVTPTGFLLAAKVMVAI